MKEFDLGEYDETSHGGITVEGSSISSLNILGRLVILFIFSLTNFNPNPNFFRYFWPNGLRHELVVGNSNWSEEQYSDDEIGRIYSKFPIVGWLYSDPVLARLGRLYYTDEETVYDRAGHIYCCQLAETEIRVLDR